MSTTKPDLLGTAQVAALLGVSVATVNRWVNDGKLTATVVLPGRTGVRLYARADVEAMRPEPSPESGVG